MVTMMYAAARTAEWKYFLIEFCWFVLCTMLMKFMRMVTVKSYALLNWTAVNGELENEVAGEFYT